MSTSKPTPEGTLAILLGASQWPDCGLPGDEDEWRPFQRSIDDVYDYLTNPDYLAIPHENVNRALFDSDINTGTMLKEISGFIERRRKAIEGAGQEVTDLIVYYVGHGDFANKDNDFFLAIRGTDKDQPFLTGLPIEGLAKAIVKPARFLRRYIILDCCFAAAAVDGFYLSDPGKLAVKLTQKSFPRDEPVTGNKNALPGAGTALLCASSAKRRARTERTLEQTMFTWGLLNALKTGEAKAPPKLSVQELYSLVSERIETRFPDQGVRPELHEPDQDQGSVAEVPLFPNVGWRRSGPSSKKQKAPAIKNERSTPKPSTTGPERRWPSETVPARRLGACEAIDSFVCAKSPLFVWLLAAILGGSVLFLSVPVDAYIVQIFKVASTGPWRCNDGGKQVGLWSAPNWLIVYLLLLPIFLSRISAVSGHLRNIISESATNRAFVDAYEAEVGKAKIKDDLRGQLRANNGIFALLGGTVALLTLTGWWTSVGRPIWNHEIGNQVIDWSTLAAVCPGWSFWPSLIFTLIAYIWMGLGLFVYFACLFLNFIYASFLQRLAAGDQDEADDPSPGRLIFQNQTTAAHFRDFLTPFVIACLFGLLAVYCMRLQADYVGSPNATVAGYWVDDFNQNILRNPAPSNDLLIQRPHVSNQSKYTSIFVLIITFVALAATTWQLQAAFRDAKEHLLSRYRSRRTQLYYTRELTPQTIKEIERTEFIPSVIPNLWPLAVLLGGFALATFFGLRSLFFVAIAVAAAIAWLAVALRRRRKAGEGPSDASA